MTAEKHLAEASSDLNLHHQNFQIMTYIYIYKIGNFVHEIDLQQDGKMGWINEFMIIALFIFSLTFHFCHYFVSCSIVIGS